ncbi:Methylenetetrahydrofolate reductase [Desulfamplus magnetovallimortis]|uniref:Methylenetetrahydrofolate reductase n=1 Tax=Desulfamplus magnetovallimortis TaxID=1246637 RepID=A0A1W1HAX7_9BACT|nr:methylenetetrahydrofolate reductase [Desulfamplus magnetovallimortis]SLM29572.1 Methylenetetrahydrofolate reductase [Desulfamplus magnetovallimortis]
MTKNCCCENDNHGTQKTIPKIDLDNFLTTIEVVPPAGSDPSGILSALDALKDLPVNAFSIATNPVAKPRMCALSLSALIQQKTCKPAILHCTTRDHNKLGLQATLWGAKALGIHTVMAATGDFVSMNQRKNVSDVKDLNVFELITMANESDMLTGAVLDFRPEANGLEKEVERLEKKAAAGASFAVTQPIYDRDMARTISITTGHIDIPIIMGILPLRTAKHARFLNEKVAGIAVPEKLLEKMESASDPIAQGVENAKEMLSIAKEFFRGACIMPPFDHYEIMPDILKSA